MEAYSRYMVSPSLTPSLSISPKSINRINYPSIFWKSVIIMFFIIDSSNFQDYSLTSCDFVLNV